MLCVNRIVRLAPTLLLDMFEIWIKSILLLPFGHNLCLDIKLTY
jgi:hypothetical protein